MNGFGVRGPSSGSAQGGSKVLRFRSPVKTLHHVGNVPHWILMGSAIPRWGTLCVNADHACRCTRVFVCAYLRVYGGSCAHVWGCCRGVWVSGGGRGGLWAAERVDGRTDGRIDGQMDTYADG